jgi:hypothetical protein
VPLFACACLEAVRRSQPLLLLYAAPALVMLALHTAVANQYTRYDLILIGPFCAGAPGLLRARDRPSYSGAVSIRSEANATRSSNWPARALAIAS